MLFHHIVYTSFLFSFESSVSFIFLIDLLATRKTIIAVLFLHVLFIIISSRVLYRYLDCIIELVLFGMISVLQELK